ncbi:MAG: BatA domain-containing protein [Bacteroidales bacterium]|nr:BatA domain-containing protein [Bacteroidales bacterium]
MQFQNPSFLYGLFALLIPVIIHLFNFRRYKKVYFSSIQFLKNIQLETRKQSRLKQLILLAIRMLIFAMIIFAFADPVLSDQSEERARNDKHAVSIFIDNSFSMEAEGTKGVLFEQAKMIAYDILNQYNVDDRFQLLTMDFEARHQKWLSKEEFTGMLQELSLSPYVHTIPQIMSRQHEMFDAESDYNNQVYLISDFQKNISAMEQWEKDSLCEVFLIPLNRPVANNIFIDSCWFDEPVNVVSKNLKLNVRIKNSSSQSLEHLGVKLYLEGKQRALASCDIEANSTTTTTLFFSLKEAAWYSGSIQIDDYPVTYDDDFYISFLLRDQTDILSINQDQNSPYLTALYNSDSAFNLINSHIKKLNFSTLNTNQLIILHELDAYGSGLLRELKSYVEQGGCLIVIPSEDYYSQDSVPVFKDLCSIDIVGLDTVVSSISDLNSEHPLYKNTYSNIPEDMLYPKVVKHFVLDYPRQTSVEVVLRLLNGDPFLVKQNVEKGNVYVFSSPLDSKWTNFMKHNLFVPTFINIASQSETMQKLYYEIGEQSVMVTKETFENDQAVKLKDRQGTFELIPSTIKTQKGNAFNFGDEVRFAGNYDLSQDKLLAQLSFNYKRLESDLQIFSANDIGKWIRTNDLEYHVIDTEIQDWLISVEKDTKNNGLWYLCIWSVLLLLVAETVLLRFWR